MFQNLNPHNKESIFFQPPRAVHRRSEQGLLAYALGATLYMPATRLNLVHDLLTQKEKGCSSSVICLEDAIGDHEVRDAEENLLKHLKALYIQIQAGIIQEEKLPFIFVRVRSSNQMNRILQRAAESSSVLTGFSFPKFSPYNAGVFLETLHTFNKTSSAKLYGMPILETSDVVYKETRFDTLLAIRSLLAPYRDSILNIRMGATDFSSLFGLRRGADVTIYDIAAVRDCLADILNVFGRFEEDYVISGPVWEYFSNGNRLLKPQLRQSVFEQSYGRYGQEIRNKMVDNFEDGLIKEVILDKENGIIGKTVIHPSHILPVHSLYVVSHEEYLDAQEILKLHEGQNGVVRSLYRNKMNEVKPHLNWAKRILKRAHVYGVYHENRNFTHLLAESVLV